MRVSDVMIRELVTRANAVERERLAEASVQVSTGQRVGRPSDDPVAAARVSAANRSLQLLEAYQKSRYNVRGDMELAESKLLELQDVVGDMKALVIDLVSDDVSGTDRAAGAASAVTRFKQLLALANTQAPDGHFIFAGASDTSAPFDDVGNYSGAVDSRQVEVAPGVSVEGAIVGEEAFGRVNAPGEPVDGYNVFALWRDVVEALENNDVPFLQSSLDYLDDVFDDLRRMHANVGARISALDNADVLSEDLNLILQEERSTFRDTDLAVASTTVSAASNSLQIIAQLGNSLLSNSVTTFLR